MNYIWIAIAIIVLFTFFYIIGSIIRKKNQTRLDALEEKREKLLDQPIVEEIEEVKRMHLVGQSQNTFREWNQKWTDISTSSYADLEAQILDIENMNERFRFFKAQHLLETAEHQLSYMEQEVESIRSGLKELRESEERNSLAVQETLDTYEELKKRLTDEKEVFDRAVTELERKLYDIEIEFTQFVTLNTTGDPIEAREVLLKAEQHTFKWKEKMDKIPQFVEELREIFPSQVEELETGYHQLLEQNYVFPEENKNIEENLNHIKNKINDSFDAVEKIELDTVETLNRSIDGEINDLYDLLEREIKARKYVLVARKQIQEYLDHAKKNNRQLLIELDHILQSYTLNNNELGRARGYQSEIEKLEKKKEDLLPQIDNHKIPYSKAQKFFKHSYKVLDDIESNQVQISENVKKLRVGEKEASEQMADFEFQLRNIKRFVEKQRLPGLPSSYLEFFFVASDRVEELANKLNKIRIDMDEINQLVKYSAEDIKSLKQKTDELIDSAALAEQMMQYANRYRHANAQIKDAIDKSLMLFTHEYRYKEALDEIGTALNEVEPGAFSKIENFYYKNLDPV
ncbi:MAG: septation ring formation regulator EzrA [Streptococcaceae bacterium]|jgi:septation ring formation regulator|nr:septation ring formation regulator EzrA [Streptococcaceae bacterium]